MAAAVADEQALVDRELVALGLTAEVVERIENEDTGVGPDSAPIEPGSGKPADSPANHDEVIAFFDRKVIDRIAPIPGCKPVRDRERAGVLAAQPGEPRGVARRIRRDLLGRRQSRDDRQGHSVEKVSTRNVLLHC